MKNTNNIGKKCENIVYNWFKNKVSKVEQITDKDTQYKCGDMLISNSKGIKRFVEVKAGHTFNGVDKIAIDLFYYCNNNGFSKYIPSNSSDNKGWLYNLSKCDILAVVPKQNNKLYIIKKWLELRNNLINCIDLSKLQFDIMWEMPLLINKQELDLCVNKKDKLKNTVCLTMPLNKKIIKLYGGELLEYNL